MNDMYEMGINITAVVCVVAYIVFIVLAWYEFLHDVANNITPIIKGELFTFSDMLGLTVASFFISFVGGVLISVAWPLGLPVAILSGMYFVALKIGEHRAASRKLDLSKS